MLLFTLIQSLALSFVCAFVGQAWAATDPAELDKFIRARVEIGEMMMSYFRERGVGEKGMPSQEAMREMQTDINARLSKLLQSHGLTVDEYRRRSKEVFADEAAVNRYLEQHPDLKKRYEALPSRGSRGGRESGN